ncbi:hypothetical protein EIL87_06180 [Saccharopolyspora rhizosphaerae]|uniref:Uncharacterized protein n=1 Tax=Saccharopolyspora rhizosphaerae TaxID=2492662 RepID=A0A426K0D3_9PSEU|nr:hypothetical protein EIL87_06180 [Saccharopolyspora rhizosphaerae]
MLAGLLLTASFGAGGAAAAADKPDPSEIHAQAQEAGTVQNNINVSPLTQVSIGSDGEQAAMNWAQQINSSATDQEQDQGED